MLTFTCHRSATCPECGAPLSYGAKEEPSRWKIYFDCNDRCGLEQIVGGVSLPKVDHRDDVNRRFIQKRNEFGAVVAPSVKDIPVAVVE